MFEPDEIVQCPKCNKEVKFSEMPPLTSTRFWCKECVSQHQKDYRKKNPDKIKGYELKRKRNGFEITLEEYNEMVIAQGDICAICRKDPKVIFTDIKHQSLMIDHNHLTKEIRGLLCANCNLALGHLKEDEDIIWNMLEYLKKTTWKMTA